MQTDVGALGEGGHNYHHTFPQDYRTSEYPLSVNWTKLLIDVFAAMGWVYDRKTVAEEVRINSLLTLKMSSCFLA